jgi:DNA modification methylase
MTVVSISGPAAEAPVIHTLPNGPVYRTKHGTMYKGLIEEVIKTKEFGRLKGKAQLLFFSPPFPLNRKKRYGNETGTEYVRWLARLAPLFKELLTPTGSIVVEVGNAWEKGSPVMSVLAMRAMLAFMKKGGLNLCQQFICDNPARLPGPVQWVNRERIRVKDSFTHVWWLAVTDHRRVLKPYSKAMLDLIRTKRYNAGQRPSGHLIGKESFFTDNGGAIPSNCLSFSNTKANDPYQQYCREHKIKPHPARMPIGLAEFFIKFLTDENDLVIDPFSGSNTTGAAAEGLKRKWVSVEARDEYILASKSRFPLTVNVR